MDTLKFQQLINDITGRDFKISTTDTEIIPQKEYIVFRILPFTKYKISFKFKTAKTEDKLLRSFITAYTSKYREPNPKAYNKTYGGVEYLWDNKTEEEKEYAYMHHSGNMYSKDSLLKQIEEKFNNPEICEILIRNGFYSTEYGVGIFCLFYTEGVKTAIEKMSAYLKSKNIPFINEFSDAHWVYRFKLNLTKEAHRNILQSF